MALAAALIYWVIVVLWLAVLATVAVCYVRNAKTFGTMRMLLLVVAIDTARNIFENFYFGLYFGSKYGLFSSEIGDVLGNAYLLILPKLLNVVAACAVLGLLLWRWLPKVRHDFEETTQQVREKSDALAQESEERRHLFDTSLDLILITDRRGKIVRVSPSSHAILGYAPAEMIGHLGGDFIYPDDLDPVRSEMRKARRGREMRNFETRYVHKDGRIVTLAWSGVWSEQTQQHFFIGHDVTENKRAEQKLKHLAHFDQLTGLPNRVTLQKDLEAEIRSSEVSIAMFDLDGFKSINDTLGHSFGDLLLQEVARRLTGIEGEQIQFYRLGGDEFVLIQRNCSDPRIIARTVDASLARLAEKFDINDHQIFLGASAGIAIGPADGPNAEDLMSNADLALYDAKAAGGNTYRLFVPVLRAMAQARRELETELRRAYTNNEFELHYQPQVRSSDGVTVGVEALLRWRHPMRGVLSPAIFIDALSESPVVHDVGRWILQSACRQAAAWRAAGLPLRVGVNLFPAHFHGETLLEDVEYALKASGLPADALELEITENIALGKDETSIQALVALRDKGVSVAFDDFGTGYASLSYLVRYPLTRIKIDQSFIRKIGNESPGEEAAIVRSIIIMAHNLGLEVTAEGVETAAQAAFLHDERCEELQGYFYAKPLVATELENFVREQREGEARVAAIAG